MDERASPIGANYSFVGEPSDAAHPRHASRRKPVLLADKTAVISGAASARGIGRATAKLFAEQGARVAVLDLDAAGAEQAAAELGEGHIGIGCDVADLASCR